MAGGQTLGIAVMGILGGALLGSVGLPGTATFGALCVLPAMLLTFSVTERPGDKRLPDCIPGATKDEDLPPLPQEARRTLRISASSRRA
jgi:hypothetical protein